MEKRIKFYEEKDATIYFREADDIFNNIREININCDQENFLDISVLDGVIFSKSNYISMLSEGVFP